MASLQASSTSANLEVFDISKKEEIKQVYTLYEVSGGDDDPYVVGEGDITYNPRRNLLGAIPIGGQLAYHLFKINTDAAKTSKPEDIVKVVRQSKWHSQYGNTHISLSHHDC